MKATNDRMYLAHAGEITRALQGIDEPRVTATGEHHQTFVLYVEDDRLIVMDPRIGLPPTVDQCNLIGAALLVRRGARNLPGHQGTIADEHRRPALFDYLNIFRFQILPAGWKMLGFVAVTLNVLALEIRIRVQHDRHFRPAVALDEPKQTPGMVRMAVAQ